MRRLAGPDASLEETAARVADEEGRVAREARAPGEPEALAASLRGPGLALGRIGPEARSPSGRRHEGPTAAGPPAVRVGTPRRAKAATSAMPDETGRNDARAVARTVRAGWFRAVRVESPACRSRRAPPAARRSALDALRDVGNGPRAPLREAGLKLGAPTAASGSPHGRASSPPAIPCPRPRPSRCSRPSRPRRASRRGSPGARSPPCAPSRSAAGRRPRPA